MILKKTSDLGFIPKRIISLVPSQTELLYDLGLVKETIGITKFCVHPNDWFNRKTKVGGTKSINPDIIDQLKPDLIIANKEENAKNQIEQLASVYNVWLTDVNDLGNALAMIKDIGELTAKEKEADSLIYEINSSFDLLNLEIKNVNPKHKTAYLIWRNPFMVAGGDTFIHNMLLKCGFENIFANQSRYPEVTLEYLLAANCQLLLLSSEPYPFKQKHLDELAEQLPGIAAKLVDGELFSWYGSRMLKAPGYFSKLINSL